MTVPGGAAEFAVAPVENCVRLPEGVAPADAALIEPLSCAVRGFDVLPRQLGDHYLIYGAGTMGLMMLELAKRAGAASVSRRRPQPRPAGDRDRGSACTAAGASADELDRPRGWDVVIDCTGVRAAIEDGLGRVAPGGTFLQFGVADEAAPARFSPFRIYNEEIRSSARWRCCTASSGPPTCSSPACSTRRCSSATGSRWSSTRRDGAVPRRRRPQDPGDAAQSSSDELDEQGSGDEQHQPCPAMRR